MIHQGTHEKLTHVCSEHPELPVNSEVVMYLSHPFGPHKTVSAHTDTLQHYTPPTTLVT